MPTYEYVCDACSHEFELFQQMSAPVKRKCPACGKPKLRRLIGTGAGILFKGSGFYETDYRSDSYKKAAESEKKSADGGEKPSSDSKAEAKPEKKSESSTKSDGAAASTPAKSNGAAKPAAKKPKKSSGE